MLFNSWYVFLCVHMLHTHSLYVFVHVYVHICICFVHFGNMGLCVFVCMHVCACVCRCVYACVCMCDVHAGVCPGMCAPCMWQTEVHVEYLFPSLCLRFWDTFLSHWTLELKDWPRLAAQQALGIFMCSLFVLLLGIQTNPAMFWVLYACWAIRTQVFILVQQALYPSRKSLYFLCPMNKNVSIPEKVCVVHISMERVFGIYVKETW